MYKNKELRNGDMFLWHNLPALVVDDNVALFSNLNGELKVIELEKSELDDEAVYRYAQECKLFDCLTNFTEDSSDKITLVMTLTRGCNCLCRYCFLSANTEGKSMTEKMIYSIIDKAFERAKGKRLVITFLGGEPTFRFQDIKLSVLYAEKHPGNVDIKGLQFGITTNGVFSEKIADFFIQHNFKISMSVDGIPCVQDFHRPLANGTGSSKIVEQNILKLVKHLPVKILGTVTEFSVDKLEQSVEYFAGLGVKRVFFNPVTKRGRGLNDDNRLQPPSPEQFVENLKKAIMAGEKLGVNVISFPYMNLMSSPMKYCNGNRLVINYDGDISSCVEIQEKQHPLFKNFKIGYFDQDKQSVILTEESHKCADSLTIQKKCEKCPFFFFCGEGCPARNFIGSSNQYEIDDYRCLITKKIMPFILRKIYLSTYKK